MLRFDLYCRTKYFFLVYNTTTDGQTDYSLTWMDELRRAVDRFGEPKHHKQW